jgi:hypothetical protein
MGRHTAAAAAFASVVDDPAASSAQRWEALVRLGVARREAGDARGGIEAFERAARDYADDAEAKRFLLQAIGSALPGEERWKQVWRRVSVEFDRAAGATRVRWPDAPPGMCPCDGARVTLDFKDGDLQDVLRLMADVSGLNVVAQPGLRGQATIDVHDEPWDLVLERLLAPNGYVARRNGNVVWVGRAEEAPRWTTFTGKPIDFAFENVELVAALEEIAAHGGARVRVADGVAGRVTFKLVAVPWDQAFDLVAGVNGLVWNRAGGEIDVSRR